MSDGYDNLQEQKPDRDYDDWENESLTEVIIASIEEETALDLKFGNEKIDKAVHFLCFSTESGQDTVKEAQVPLAVENTSLKSARITLSTVFNENAD